MTQVQDSARCDGRRPDELRPLGFSRGFTKYAEGSVLVSAGDTAHQARRAAANEDRFDSTSA